MAALADAATEDAETLTLRLSNPTGATLADAEATGTVANVAPPPPPVESLSAHLAESPAEHMGEPFAVRIAFSAPLVEGARKALRNGAVSADGGAVRHVRRVDGRRDLWSVRLRPAGADAVTRASETMLRAVAVFGGRAVRGATPRHSRCGAQKRPKAAAAGCRPVGECGSDGALSRP